MDIGRRTVVERHHDMWRSYARTGHVLNLLVLVIDTAYVLATWRSGAHRPFLLGLNLASIVGLVAALALVPEARIARSPHRDLLFGGWMLVGAVLITTAAWADGGVRSPLAWLLLVTVMFTAVAHRPVMVWLAGGFAVVGYLILVMTSSVAIGPASTLTRLAYLTVLTFAAASSARARWGHLDAQAVRHAELTQLADVDGLTGVLNHRAFHQQLAVEIAACERRSLPTTVLLIDLDHFKCINDRYGHLIGDEVLRRVSAAITGALREGDVVGRIGGEEFAVCLGATTMPDAQRLAERVRAAVAEVEDPEPITASIGIGTSAGGATGAADLLGQADEALYLAKHQGRNRTCWLRVA